MAGQLNVFFISQEQYEELSAVRVLDVRYTTQAHPEYNLEEFFGKAQDLELYGTMKLFGKTRRPIVWNPLYCVCPFPVFELVVNEARYGPWYGDAHSGGEQRELVERLSVISDEHGFAVSTLGYEQTADEYYDRLHEGKDPDGSGGALSSSPESYHSDEMFGYEMHYSKRRESRVAAHMPELDLYTGEIFIPKQVVDEVGRQFHIAEDGQPGPIAWADMHEAARHCGAVASFCLMLNNRDVIIRRISNPHKLNRQQKRAAQRSGDYHESICYVVEVPRQRTVRELINETAHGHNARLIRPHQVRAHPRRLPEGKVTRVRSHVRGGTPEQKSYYNARNLAVVTHGCEVHGFLPLENVS